jgi:SAM-dependent methyltransferase
MVDVEAAHSWDAEYAAGRYEGEPPVSFVHDIVVAAKDARVAAGLYVGCGNGRNYVPLVDAGLDLVGLDISETAIAQLGERLPERRDRLVAGDLSALPPGALYPLVVGIQVFQHGDRAATHAFLADALRRVTPGGLFAVRVNAVGTDVHHAHEVVERDVDGSYSVRYTVGPKTGLTVHFWAAQELETLIGTAGVVPALELRPHATRRKPPQSGLWLQWEAIWLCR